MANQGKGVAMGSAHIRCRGGQKAGRKNIHRPMTSVIVLDPGHGGSDHGTTWPQNEGPYELIEKDLTLLLCRQLRQRLISLDWPIAVEMTREGDDDMSLHARGAVAKKYGADLVLSIHINSSPEEKHSGMITFARAGDIAGSDVAKVITESAPQELRRKRNGFFSCDPLEISTNDWARWLSRANNVLERFAPVPSVLIEACHATNQKDRDEIRNPGTQAGVASACILGVERYLSTI